MTAGREIMAGDKIKAKKRRGNDGGKENNSGKEVMAGSVRVVYIGTQVGRFVGKYIGHKDNDSRYTHGHHPPSATKLAAAASQFMLGP